LKGKVEIMEKQLASVESKLDTLSEQITKYKGFLGAITFIGTCVITFVTLALSYFKH